jgi:hypothetical protein
MEHPGIIYCPDCDTTLEVTPAEFVAHRQTEHPPEPRAVAVSGIQTREAHGYQPTEED